MYSSSRDNWERLVSAVVRREQIWQMFHDHSRNPSTIESESESESGDEDFTSQLRFSSNRAISVTNPSTSKVGKNGIGSLTRKLFAALYPNQKPNHQDYVDVLGNEHAGVTRFSLHELVTATDNFSNKNILEDCGPWLSMLYIGQLANGCVVAVKRIIMGDSGNAHRTFQADAHRTFQAQVEAMSIVVHPNVLSLLGICSTRREKLLILPLMVNGSVGSWLRDRLDSRAPLDWAVRQRIAVGVAKGLAYLHGECERKIIHCDVRAANIYLNEDFEAVIGNFCIATIMDHSVTHVTTVVRGTGGHIAPEYLHSGTCSEQTDVFNYGIFLLELITGQSAFDLARLANDEDVMLLDWVKSAVKEVQWERIVDPEVGSNYIEEGVEQLTKIALVCTDTNPERRPRMLDIVRMLQFGDGLYKMWEEWCRVWSPRESVQPSSPR